MGDGLPYSKNMPGTHTTERPKSDTSRKKKVGGGGSKTTGWRTVKTKLREMGLRWGGGELGMQKKTERRKKRAVAFCLTEGNGND